VRRDKWKERERDKKKEREREREREIKKERECFSKLHIDNERTVKKNILRNETKERRGKW
jgi:hypothetical protein